MKDHKAILHPDSCFHIFNRAVGSEHLFANEGNYFYFLKLYRQYISPLARTFCYCLLPNHFHLFLKTRTQEEVAATLVKEQKEKLIQSEFADFALQQFSNFFNAYTKAFNNQQRRRGKLFMEPFSRKAIGHPEHNKTVAHYIHVNPLHQGFCKRVDDWPYSSYQAIKLQVENSWLSVAEVMSWFGSAEEFEAFHYQPVERKFAI